MSLRFERLRIPDVILVEAQPFTDTRGFFLEAYRQSVFADAGITTPFVQDNQSRSVRGVLRGLHYQNQPQAQAKLVMVPRGEVFDVMVDIRRGAPTYGQWVGVVLSDRTHRMLYAPVGFAHGFCVLSEEADVLYKVSAEYAPDLERGIIWNDSDLAIAWPMDRPVLSSKDQAFPPLRAADNNLAFVRTAP